MFGTLALIGLAGIVGPLLSAGPRPLVPVVVGEIAAGVVIGRTGFRWLDAGDPVVVVLADAGFAMLMFTAGMHVPIRDPRLRSALGRGSLAAAGVGLLAIPCAIGVSAALDTGHAAVYGMLLATGSAAVVLPVLEEQRLLATTSGLLIMAQITVADVVTIVGLPLVLQPDHAAKAALGGLLVSLSALAVFAVAFALHRHPFVKTLRKRGKHRGWALDLRVALIVLFGLSYLARRSGTSVLVAGFATGLIVAAIGGPKRLSQQVLGIGQGFFVPLFFVVLGARLDLRALVQHPSTLELALALLVLGTAIRVIVSRLAGQPAAAGLVTTAQLGVPAAAVTLGLRVGIMTPGQGAAIIAAALGTLALTAIGASRLAVTVRPSTPAKDTPSAAADAAPALP